jgi:hypothetical protein
MQINKNNKLQIIKTKKNKLWKKHELRKNVKLLEKFCQSAA